MNTQQKIRLGLDLFMKEDGYLMLKNLNERTMTHKLAEKYQQIFYEWNVDCEFNRNLDGPKEVEFDPKKLLKLMAQFAKRRKEKLLNFGDYTETLIQQLEKPEIDYLEDLDLWVFLLKLGNKTIKKIIFPDIIIHQRGTAKNHIVIEVKKSNNLDPIARSYDIIKLATLVHSPEYKYEVGIFIDIPVLESYMATAGFKPVPGAFDKVYEYVPKYRRTFK